MALTDVILHPLIPYCTGQIAYNLCGDLMLSGFRRQYAISMLLLSMVLVISAVLRILMGFVTGSMLYYLWFRLRL